MTLANGVRVSVCVPTYCRPDGLTAALEHLTALDPPDGGYEVVVVDNGSSPELGVPAILERAATRSPVPVRWTSIEINRGPAPARNLAWQMAEGEWIAFTDDDCRPAADWLVQLLKTADEAQAEVVQGRTLPDPERAHLLDRPFARSMLVEGPTGYFQTCNILYRRALVEKIGGFDEGYHLSGDDTDLGWKATEAGARLAFAADAVVVHNVVTGNWRSDLRSRRRWGDVVRVIARHPGSRRLAWKRYVFRRTHAPLLVLAAGTPILARRRGRRLWAAGLGALLLSDVLGTRSIDGTLGRWQRRVGDAYEIGVLLVASWRERTLLL